MLGIGKWKFTVDVFLYKGDVIINIAENNGEYVITPEIPGFHEELTYELLEAKVIGNTLHVAAAATLLPGKKVLSGDLTFDGDKCVAKADIPYLGFLDLGVGVKIG